MKKFIKKSIAATLTAVMIMGMVVDATNSKNITHANEKKQDYIVLVEHSDANEESIGEKYDDSHTISGGVKIADDEILNLSLSKSEVKKIEESDQIISIEKDEDMLGSVLTEVDVNDRTYDKWNVKEDVQWNLKMINADDCKWSKNRKREIKKVKVAIIDSGIDYSSDIEVKERKNFIPGEDKISPLYEDGSGHGTSVAGIIAAKNNNEGITGVNENVEIYSAKVLDADNKAPVSRVISAIEWAIEKDVKIINMSLGMKNYSNALYNVIKKAYDKGILIVTAAGNGGAVEYPAAFDETLAVGSVGADGNISDDSSMGDSIDVVAPGEQIISTAAFGGTMATSGTSVATPHVTGMASVLWGMNGNVPAEFIRHLICVSARNAGEKKKYGSGIIDLEYAIKHYDEALKEYNAIKKDNGNEIIEQTNKKEIECFDNSEIIEGRWGKTAHENLASKANNYAGGLSSEDLKILKSGLSAQDYYLIYKGNDPQTDKYKTFHGYNNYVNAYEYVMNMALKCRKSGLSEAKKIAKINSNGSDVSDCNNINKAITESLIKKVLNGKTYNKRNSALVLMGMAMHIVSDTYAHRAYVPGSPYWTHITHDLGADKNSTAIGIKRYKASEYAVGEVLAVWNGNTSPSFEEYDLVGIYNHSTSFRLICYNDYSARCWNGIDYDSYKNNIKKLSCKFIAEGKGTPE